MKFKRVFILFLSLATMLGACSNPVGSDSSNDSNNTSISPNEISYSIEYYFESLTGDFFIDNTCTVNASDEEGTTITAPIETFEGFTYDQNNTNNVISGELSNALNTFKLYYTRNEYKVTVYGGTADKEVAKFEEKVLITPNIEGSEITLMEGAKASLEGNYVTMGAEELIVKCLTQTKVVVSNAFFTAKEKFTAQVTLDITDVSNVDGLVFSYVSSNMSQSSSTTYYVFGTNIDGVALYKYSNNHLDIVKKVVLDNRLSGTHTLSVNVLPNNVIKCYVDEIETLSTTADDFISNDIIPINSLGRIGVYSKNQIFSYRDLVITSGVLTFNQVKNQTLAELRTFKFSRHEMDFVNNTVKEGDIDVDIFSTSIADVASQYALKVNAATNAEELDKALEGAFRIKLEVQKEYTRDHLMKLIEDIHNGNLNFYAEEAKSIYLDTNIEMSRDYLERDLRPFVPDAYKLRGAEGTICLLDKLEMDLESATTTSEVYEISDRFALDLAKAIAFKDYEFYFYEQYGKYQNSTFPVFDWFFYNYYNEAGKGFVYTGRAFPNYTWNKDYRLNKFIHGTPEDNGSTTIWQVVDLSGYMMRAQTIKARKYTITLNSNGGILPSHLINHTSETSYRLPIPTKEGYTFDGWYYSTRLQGNKVSVIQVGNLNNVTLYAAWIKDGVRVDSDIIPSDFITENMIIQQKKPIIISGTGKVGVTVTATFNGVDLSTTVGEDGKWNVIFSPLDASFEERTLTITSGDITYTFNNIVIGEVWLGAGQSNMEMLPVWLNNRGLQAIGEYGKYTNFSKIRIFRQYCDTTPITDEDNNLQDRWVAPKKLSDLFDKSMLSFVFACCLQEKLNIPVGVVTSARGGTYIEEWLSRENLEVAGTSLTGENKALECRYYDCMTVDLKGLQINGVIWYQGCNNWATPELYKSQFAALAKQYREEIFNDGDLPIIVQQLVQYSPMEFKDFRLMQWDLMDIVDNTYTACAIDTGEEYDIHPADKDTLGTRMARIAAQYVYGIGEDSLSYTPTKAVKVNDKIVISFENGKTIKGDSSLNHFKVKKTNGEFIDVDATIVNNTIVIDYVEDAAQVYYAYANWLGKISLYGGNGLPVAPFAINID